MFGRAAANHWEGRHPSVAHFEPLFEYKHLPEHLQSVSMWFSALAQNLLSKLQDGPELSVALRKLLEAKDAAVRQAVIDGGAHPRSFSRDTTTGEFTSAEHVAEDPGGTETETR